MSPMSTSMRKIRYWAPRVLCVAFAAFLGVFALDVFSMHIGPGEKLIALAMHLIPSGIVLAALLLVWRWEWIGALVFPALALWHFATKSPRMVASGYLVIEIPLVLLGLLFLLSWLDRQEARREVRG